MLRWILFVGVIASLARPARAEEVADPYLWLEEVTSDQALAWVSQQNEQSTRELTTSAAFQALDARLLKIMDSEEKIPFVAKAGPLYYNFWRDAHHPRGVWRRTTLEEYRKPQTKWEVVLDLDALGKAEKESWVWHGASFLRPSCQRCLLLLSRGGADADVVREFDVTSRSFVKDGFTLPEAKSDVAWRDRDSLFLGTDFGPGSLTKSGYPRLVKEWKRGTPPAEARLVFEGRPEDVGVGGYRTQTPGYQREFVSRGITTWENELFLRRNGQSHSTLRLWGLRDLAGARVRSDRRRGMDGTGRRLRRGQHPRGRRVRPEVAPGSGQSQPAPGLRGFHRGGRGPDPAPGHLAGASGDHGREQRGASDGQYADHAPRPLRRHCLPIAAAGHAALPQMESAPAAGSSMGSGPMDAD
jgi:hypothetical protein